MLQHEYSKPCLEFLSPWPHQFLLIKRAKDPGHYPHWGQYSNSMAATPPTSVPHHMASSIKTWQLIFIRANIQWGQTWWEPESFCSLVSEPKCHHLCHILWVGRESPYVQPRLKEWEIIEAILGLLPTVINVHLQNLWDKCSFLFIQQSKISLWPHKFLGNRNQQLLAKVSVGANQKL